MNKTRIFGTVVLIFIVLALAVYWCAVNRFVPAGTTYSSQEVEIPLHYSTNQIAALLEEKGIIKSALFFRLYARYSGYDQQLQAGRYLFYSGMDMDDILQELQRGTVPKESRRFTVPEGFTVEQIAARLAEMGLVNEDSFKEACRHYQNAEFDFLTGIPSGVYYNLEGYLFPDTYDVYLNATAEDIIAIMLRRFNTLFDEDYRPGVQELGLTLHQVVTIASLVEKEGCLSHERPLISAVFHNRLYNDSMPLLQSCATVQYALGETKEFLTNADLKIDSPYNTYIHPHLPPGPIASPGLEALSAALQPAEVDYLYFVSKEDGSGEHYFSATLKEHNRYKALARRARMN